MIALRARRMRLYDRSPRGTRLIGTAPYGHWKTTTFLAGLRHDGLIAPLVLDGPINGEAFLAWTEQFLAPQLRPGDIVVTDRLGSHKGHAAGDAIAARGAERLRPSTWWKFRYELRHPRVRRPRWKVVWGWFRSAAA